MYSIQEVCRKTGLTAHTLRYYEKEKLLPGISRSTGGFRQYTDEDLESLGMICCLKNTGMSVQDIARFMALTREGDRTLRARCEMLQKHREKVLERIEEMQRHLEKVTWKCNFFAGKLRAFEEEQRKQGTGE